MDLTSFSGSGFQYIQQQLLRSVGGERDPSTTEKSTADDRFPTMSETSKHLLIQLLKDENIRLSDYSSGSLSKSHRQEGAQNEMKVVDLTTMSDEMILDLAYKNEISLFGSILFILDQYLTNDSCNTTSTSNVSCVSTKYILQKCVYAVPPHQTPGLMSAQDMILMALHFLCQEYSCPKIRSDAKGEGGASSELQLPLLYTTSAMGDLERRNYAKAYDWSIDEILPHVFELEQDFYSAILDDFVTSGKERSDITLTHYHWLPREKFCPPIRFEDTLRRPLIMHGHSVASTNSNKPRAKTAKGVKRKQAVPLESKPPTSSVVMKTIDDDSTQSEGDDAEVAGGTEFASEE